MEKVAIIGHAYEGKTTLTTAIKNALENEKHHVYQKAVEEVIEYRNPYTYLNEKQPLSKTRLKKCSKGFHEYKESNFLENNEKKWICIHCESVMNQNLKP